jgi:hypothetical protein
VAARDPCPSSYYHHPNQTYYYGAAAYYYDLGSDDHAHPKNNQMRTRRKNLSGPKNLLSFFSSYLCDSFSSGIGQSKREISGRAKSQLNSNMSVHPNKTEIIPGLTKPRTKAK